MQIKKLCGGKYARFVHRGTVAALMQTYHYIWGEWFPESSFEPADLISDRIPLIQSLWEKFGLAAAKTVHGREPVLSINGNNPFIL